METNIYFLFSGKWTAEELLTEGLVEVQENPAMITDIGMKAVGRCFPSVSHMEIYNCPHLHYPTSWFHAGEIIFFNLVKKHSSCEFKSVGLFIKIIHT